MGKGKGRSKIDIKKVEPLAARNTCFTKRRTGLFKKAAELCQLFPGVRVAAVVFSPAGNPFVLEDPIALLDSLMFNSDLKAAYGSEKLRFDSSLNDIAEKMEKEEENLDEIFSEAEIEDMMKELQGGDVEICQEIPQSVVTSCCSVSSVPIEIQITDFDFSENDDDDDDDAFVNQFINV